MVNTIDKVTEGTRVVEGCRAPKSEILVACAVVHPGSAGFPMRVMNPTGEEITYYKGHLVSNFNRVLDSAMATVSEQKERNSSTFGEQELLNIFKGCHHVGMTEADKQRFFKLLNQYSDIFSTDNNDLGRTKMLNHSIHTGDSQPVRQQPRRMAPSQKQHLKGLLQEMLANNVIQPSNSPWASPIVLVTKSDCSMRFCVDYRKLNAATRKDAYIPTTMN